MSSTYGEYEFDFLSLELIAKWKHTSDYNQDGPFREDTSEFELLSVKLRGPGTCPDTELKLPAIILQEIEDIILENEVYA